MTHAQVMEIAGRVMLDNPKSRIYRSTWAVAVFGPNKVQNDHGDLVDERFFCARRKVNKGWFVVQAPQEAPCAD